MLFRSYVDTVKALTKRVDALDQHIGAAAAESVFWPVIEGLMALRGVNLLTATTIVVEIGDLRRFDSAPQLMAYLGVVPSEHSSGGTTSRGGITKTGNGAGYWWRQPGPTVSLRENRLSCKKLPSKHRKWCKTLRGRHKRVCVDVTGC